MFAKLKRTIAVMINMNWSIHVDTQRFLYTCVTWMLPKLYM